MNISRSHNFKTLEVRNMNSLQRNIGRWIAGICSAVVLMTVPALVQAQDAANPSSPDFVSRAEYDKLKAEHEAMKKELDVLKTAVRQMAAGTVAEAPRKKTAPPPAEGP